MKTTVILGVGLAVLVCLVFCVSWRGRQQAKLAQAVASGKTLDDSWNYQIGLPVEPPDHSASLTFQIERAPSSTPTQQTWIATYTSLDHTARFTIDIDPPNRTEDHGIEMQFGSGRILANDDSDDRSILPALAYALDGKIPDNIQKQPVLKFDYVHFGEHMSPIPGGGFQFKPRGDWTAMKLFFDGKTEDDAATIYFSLNPTGGVAQFSMSNSDYGDPVLRHLATVL